MEKAEFKKMLEEQREQYERYMGVWVEKIVSENKFGYELLGNKIDKLETRVDRIEVKMDHLETRFDSLEEKVDSIQDMVAKNTEDIAEMHAG